ncbi:hypothetical protein BU26DRAFT_602870 [Trematosphaeria pertusa]|uniref:Uncharacterized protein n=1 Tax=Trematosphaeria pertusa TaxID=390896 RepID=A0A6A6IRR6_9PLEO|nr:uncharacterized protein BU26DRAFT_602870 [Trematosphaeria pertusa]KAF2252502.1 hypothetical protein BU26DRAFT_602870 [Trematosphaeria pertusa]
MGFLPSKDKFRALDFTNKKKLRALEEEKQQLQRELTLRANRQSQQANQAYINQQHEEARRKRERAQHNAKMRRLKEASPETLRSLRELIRTRYQLDVEIWNLRGVRRPDRCIAERKMEKADAVMEEILGMVAVWGDNADGLWDEDEWERVKEIRKRLMSEGKREWVGNPPWAERR